MPLISDCIACAKILAYIVSSISRNHSYGMDEKFCTVFVVHYFLIDGFLTTVVVVVVVVVISLESLS